MNPHHHCCWHGILYLTKGCDLILPELNIKITPEPGDYYLFPPYIFHGFDPVKEDEKGIVLYSILLKRMDLFMITRYKVIYE